jgi:rod shape-determining protein MreD
MIDLVWQRLDHGARSSLPFVTTIVCIFLSVITWPLPHIGAIAPPFALVALYYWALHRPDLFGPGMAFLTGLLFDLLNGLPPGISALLFVLAHHIVLMQRRFFVGHSFYMMWSGFALTATAVMLSQWFLVTMIRWQLMPLFPVLVQTLFVIILFPLPCWLFIRLQRAALTQN